MGGSPSLRRAARPALVVALVFGFAFGAALLAFLPRRTIIEPRCAFGDGIAYCAMARGDTAQLPWARRPVVPALARALPGSLAQEFRAASLLGLIGVAVLSALLADRIARRLGILDRRSRLTIAAIVVAAGMIAPSALRQALSVPALVDHGGLAIGLGWMLLLTGRSTRANVAAAPLAFVAVLTREIWVLVIPIAALFLLVTRRNRLAAVVSMLAVVAAGPVMLVLPSVPAKYDEVDLARDSYWARFDGLEASGGALWYLVFAVGLLPAVIFLFPPGRWIRAELFERRDTTAAIMLLSAFVIVVSAPLAIDFTRNSYAAGVVLLAFAAPWFVAHQTLWRAAVVLAVATVIVWTPTRHLIEDEDDYRLFYRPSDRTTVGLTVSAIALAAAGALTASDERRLRAATRDEQSARE